MSATQKPKVGDKIALTVVVTVASVIEYNKERFTAYEYIVGVHADGMLKGQPMIYTLEVSDNIPSAIAVIEEAE